MVAFGTTYQLPIPAIPNRRSFWIPSGSDREFLAAAPDARASDTMSDEQLAAAVLGGDDSAFRFLVQRYQGHVVRTVTGMLGKSSDVDDCVQDVFIRLYRSLMRYRGDASVKTYVTRIAINRSLDQLRKRKRNRVVEMDDILAESIDSGAPGPEDDAISMDDRRRLRTALNRLAPKHRTVVVLRLIEGLSTAETAEVLGVPYGTVLSRLKRALGRMKQVLVETDHETHAEGGSRYDS